MRSGGFRNSSGVGVTRVDAVPRQRSSALAISVLAISARRAPAVAFFSAPVRGKNARSVSPEDEPRRGGDEGGGAESDGDHPRALGVLDGLVAGVLAACAGLDGAQRDGAAARERIFLAFAKLRDGDALRQ